LTKTDKATTDQQPRIKLYRGWKEIASAVDSSEDSVKALADRNIDPLSIDYDPLDRPTLRSDVLADWVARNAAKEPPKRKARAKG
jgi:hypothetical protein